MKKLVFIFPLFFSFQLWAQDWQTAYDQAVEAHQAGYPQDAYNKAEESLEYFSGATEEEKKAILYSYQLLGVLALELSLFEETIHYTDKEKSLIIELIGQESPQYFESLKKSAQAHLYLSQTEEAINQFEDSWQLASRIFDVADDERLIFVGEYAYVRLMMADWQGVVDLIDPHYSALSTNPNRAEEFIYTLYYLGKSYFELEQKGKAKQYLTLFKQNIEANGLVQMEEYKDAVGLLDAIQIEQGNVENLSDQAEGNLTELLRLAIKLQSDGQTEKAEAAYQQAAERAKGNQNNHKTAFSVFYNYANFLTQFGKHQQALENVELAQERASKAFESDEIEWAMLLVLEGKIHFAFNEWDKAALAYNKAFEIALKVGGAASFNSVISPINYHLKQNDYAAAWGKVNQLFSAEQYILGLENEQLILLSNLLVDVAQLNASSVEAIQLFQAHKERILKKLADSEAAGIYLSEARLLSQTGSNESALRAIEKAKETLNEQDDQWGELYLMSATIYQRLANYQAAEQAYDQAIAYFEQKGRNAKAGINAYNAKATYFMELGNYDAAEKVINSINKGNDDAAILQNLAAIYQLSGRLKQAVSILEKSLAIDAKELGENHPTYGLGLQNLAVAYKDLGELQKAEEMLRKAIKIDQANAMTQNESYANKLGNLAMVLQEQDELEEAEKYLYQAFELRKERLNKWHPDYAFNLYGLGVLHQRKMEYAKAAEYFDEAAQIYLRHINTVFPILSEKEKAAFYDKISEVITAYYDFAIEYATIEPSISAPLFTFRMQTKALLLNASAGVRQRILQSDDTQLKEQFSAWLSVKEDLAKIYASANVDKARVEELESRANAMEKELSLKSQLFAGTFEQNQVDIADIKQSLKTDEAVVEIIRHQLNTKNDSLIYAALILKKGSEFPELVILDDGHRLDRKGYKFYNNTINFRLKDTQSYGLYWAPIESSLGEVKTIYLSPDGVYNKINLSSILDPNANQYLIEKYQIQLLTNPKSLLDGSGKVEWGDSELTVELFGNPNFTGGEGLQIDYKAISQQVSSERSGGLNLRSGINPLPGTEKEIVQISEILNKYKRTFNVNLDIQASEHQVKQIDNPLVLHIATHGYFVAAEGDDNEQDEFDSPLLRSGLMLSGIEKYFEERLLHPEKFQDEDGMLTAYEAMNLHLFNTALVVLSACETGVGELKDGEGVYGLQRSFLVAGAKHLVMSLWKVDDRATQELMVSFYEKWLESGDIPAALRLAQLELKEKYAHPYFWGGFVLTR